MATETQAVLRKNLNRGKEQLYTTQISINTNHVAPLQVHISKAEKTRQVRAIFPTASNTMFFILKHLSHKTLKGINLFPS